MKSSDLGEMNRRLGSNEPGHLVKLMGGSFYQNDNDTVGPNYTINISNKDEI